EFAVACFMAVELKSELVRDQGLKQRLAFDERKVRDIPIVKMQEIKGVVDEPRTALAVGRRLGLGEARQAHVIDRWRSFTGAWPATSAVPASAIRRTRPSC